MSESPFEVLGLTADATLTEVRAARRRIAREVHPDVHPVTDGDATAMQRVNAAFDACVADLDSRPHRPPAHSAPEPASAAPPHRRGRRLRGIEIDAPSFTIDALPAEAFEALLVVVTWLGEIVDDDPPYVLECLLDRPLGCWCRLELVPDAGGSTVNLAVAGIDDAEHPAAEHVRDVWVDELNRLGHQPP